MSQVGPSETLGLAQSGQSRAHRSMQERHTCVDPMARNRNLRRFNDALRANRVARAVQSKNDPGVLGSLAFRFRGDQQPISVPQPVGVVDEMTFARRD